MGSKVTVKLQLVLVPQVSLAVQVTVVEPTGNVLPLGGVQVTVGGEHPPEAVLVQNTTAEFEHVCAVTRMLEEQFNTIWGCW